ncbi:hypothetical protein [Kribbella sp. NBC_00889]|uniref:hypothetical protein n=1 Tax=Kribbella sp. NBC_00889 TaxID=2975974 RepID=UPI00386AB972|nr:hypothetical protein OG817_27250 [Kribbella sp. NBC_00889]
MSPATNLAALLISTITVGAVYVSFGLARELPAAELIRAAPRWAGPGGLSVLAICGYAGAVGAETLVLLAQLCLAWRRSFKQLQSSTGRELRLGVADVRRAYLDELERRQPEAFAAWLASGPRAAGDPARFFTHRAER